MLYELNTVWVEIEKRGRSFVIKDSERTKLDKTYLNTLKSLGLTPAAASGIQSLLTPKSLPEQAAPVVPAPAPQMQQKPVTPPTASAPAPQKAPQQTPPAQQSGASATPHTVPFAAPQGAARQTAESIYVVLNAKVQGGMSGSSTLVTLRAPDGKQFPAFARGARTELHAGTVLEKVKLAMRQQDTVAFYVLESYEIAAEEEQAA